MALEQADAATATATERAEQAKSDEPVNVALTRQRTLVVTNAGDDEVIEIRDATGQMELAIVMTESGPKLRLEGVSLQISGSEEIDLSCRRLRIDAAESADIHSEGRLNLTSKDELAVTAEGADVCVQGEMIYLN